VNSNGQIPSIIRNDEGLYQGNLIRYFQVVFFKAQNLENPYHNFRHMFHVLWQCYNACLFYRGVLTPRQVRNLLIAAIFHDYDHCGLMGNDDLNIARSIRELEKYVLPEDRESLSDIIALICATEFPYKIPSDKLDLCGLILRDADMTQALCPAWVQEVIFGLGSEWRKAPIEIFRMQEGFLRHLKFHTEWAKKLFPQAEIDAKISESQEYLNLLEMKFS
jgi:hypothetical protein